MLQTANLRMIELYYNLFENYCDVTKSEQLEMETDSLYLALSEHNLYDCIRPPMKKVWNSLPSGDCTDEVSANSTKIYFPRTCCAKHKKHNTQKPGLQIRTWASIQRRIPLHRNDSSLLQNKMLL